MARRQVLTVQPRPTLKKNHLYRAKVQESRVNKQAATLDVTCVQIEKPQTGRLQKFRFGLPLYPESPASQFLVACGLDAAQVGKAISVGDAVGRIIGMVFPTEDLDETSVTFEQVPQVTNETDGDADTPSVPRTNQQNEPLNRKDVQ
jgi:hypothetical protein